MKPRALAKWQQHPGLFDRDKLARARTLYEFDDVFTAPLHGFRDTPDYWARASAKPQLAQIRIPALVLNARNDPFVPGHSLPSPTQVGPHVTLWQPAHGGHVGFPHGRPPGRVLRMPQAVAHVAGRPLVHRHLPLAQDQAMDAIVEAALRKWPNVPHCHGWLALCARGNWYMRDDRVQHAGPFPKSRAAASNTRSCVNSSNATTPWTKPAPGSSRTGRSACMSSWRPRPGSGVWKPHPPGPSPATPACG